MLGCDGTKFEVTIMVTSFSPCSVAAVSEMVLVAFKVSFVGIVLLLLELILVEWTRTNPPVITKGEEERFNAVRVEEERNRHMIVETTKMMPPVVKIKIRGLA
jgi:hypothetical protein